MNKKGYTNMYEMENDFWWFRGLHELVEHYVAKETENHSLNIFDAGCGTGRMMEILQNYGTISGVDISPNAVNFTKERGLENVQTADLNEWSSGSKRYNVIYSLDVLYHKAIKDDKKVIRSFYKALEPNGILILNLQAFNILRRGQDIALSAARRYRKKPLIRELENMGLYIEKATYRLPHAFLILLLKKLFEKTTFTYKIESDIKPIPKWLNRLFYFINRIENKLHIKNCTMPVGSSLFIIARKNK